MFGQNVLQSYLKQFRKHFRVFLDEIFSNKSQVSSSSSSSFTIPKVQHLQNCPILPKKTLKSSSSVVLHFGQSSQTERTIKPDARVSMTNFAAKIKDHLHDLRGMLRSSPRLRMFRGSQHTMKRTRVANIRRVLLILRLSLIIRLQRLLGT